jgi:hypothetical protein
MNSCISWGEWYTGTLNASLGTSPRLVHLGSACIGYYSMIWLSRYQLHSFGLHGAKNQVSLVHERSRCSCDTLHHVYSSFIFLFKDFLNLYFLHSPSKLKPFTPTHGMKPISPAQCSTECWSEDHNKARLWSWFFL